MDTIAFAIEGLIPQIPRVEDVRRMILGAPQGPDSIVGELNFPDYTEACGLVVSRIASEVIMNPEGIGGADRLIADAIIELLPPEAKCLFVPAYVDLLRETGAPMTVDETTSRQRLEAACAAHGKCSQHRG